MYQTKAWILEKGGFKKKPGELKLETFEFGPLQEGEVLCETIYGSWEANMSHAIKRSPIDVARQRGDDKIILGNAGVVRVLEIGPGVDNVQVGDMCGIAPIGTKDAHGFLVKVWGYDQPKSMGLLAKMIKADQYQLVVLPKDTKYSYKQWAAFSLKYSTAWSNWKVAYGCWKQQMTESDMQNPYVWGWGGGVSFAELGLAKFFGCKVSMIASNDERLQLLKDYGINPIDRRTFADLNFDPDLFASDRAYKLKYLKAERTLLNLVNEHTDNQGVSIFLDNIGEPVFPATLRVLGRQGVISTVGWKHGMDSRFNRAQECINRHIHVHTHGCKYSEGLEAMHFGEKTGWMPPIDEKTYSWEEIPQLVEDYSKGIISDYFPLFQVNPL